MNPAWLDQLCTSGELVWIGAGSVGRSDGRVALYFRDDVRLAGPPPALAKIDRPEGEAHDALRDALAEGPTFWIDLQARLDFPAEELHEALWDLAFAGEVTNDSFAPLRNPRLEIRRKRQGRGRRFSPGRKAAGPAVQGRWSLTAPLFEGAPAIGPRLRAQAELMLERYGILTREMALAEGIQGGFSTIYPELSNLEVLGTAKRGYFIEGLGGAQFALSGAVERLRSQPQPDGSLSLIASTDPACPWGAMLPWPKLENGRRAARTAGSFVLSRDGVPLLYVEKGGRGLLRLEPTLDATDLDACLEYLHGAAEEGTLPPLRLERFDGEPLIGSGREEAFTRAGFGREPRRMSAPS